MNRESPSSSNRFHTSPVRQSSAQEHFWTACLGFIELYPFLLYSSGSHTPSYFLRLHLLPVPLSFWHLPPLIFHHTLLSPSLHPLNLLSAPSLTSPHRTPCTHRTAPSTSAFHRSFHVCVQSCRCTTNLGASSTGTIEGSMIELRSRDCWCRRRAWWARCWRWVEIVR